MTGHATFQALLLAPAWLSVCYTDYRYREISNLVVLYVAIAGIAMLAIAGAALWPVIWRSAIILLPGYAIWKLGLAGGGDVKLFVALSFWHGDQLAMFAICMALAGAVISLPCLLARNLLIRGSVIWAVSRFSRSRLSRSRLSLSRFWGVSAPEPREDRGVPYGIAIVAASVLLTMSGPAGTPAGAVS